MHTFDLHRLAQFDDAKPNVQIVARSGHARHVLFSFRAGQGLREHKTSSQIALQVLSGRLGLSAGGERQSLEPGGLALLEADTPHGVTAEVDTVMLLTLTPDPQSHSLAAELFDQIEPVLDTRPPSGSGSGPGSP